MCYKACTATPPCRAFTFIKDAKAPAARRCWLKRAGYTDAGILSAGTISGILSRADISKQAGE
eukprot:2971754-Prymnesium_polylepis.1